MFSTVPIQRKAYYLSLVSIGIVFHRIHKHKNILIINNSVITEKPSCTLVLCIHNKEKDGFQNVLGLLRILLATKYQQGSNSKILKFSGYGQKWKAILSGLSLDPIAIFFYILSTFFGGN